jgi:hypothetical protein
MAPVRILQGLRGLRTKGINYSRQRLGELVEEGLFPPPDGPNGPTGSDQWDLVLVRRGGSRPRSTDILRSVQPSSPRRLGKPRPRKPLHRDVYDRGVARRRGTGRRRNPTSLST